MDTIQYDGDPRQATYPRNWDDLRRQVLERAEYRCEGSPRYPECRAENGRPHPVTGSIVVLAAAHLYDDDEDTQDIARLRCLCQRCHTAYDADLHVRRAAENRAARQADGAQGGRRISVYEASVRAATVEIKALVVSGKQVTLSVFRQLKSEDVIDLETIELRGLPWGTINYFWKGCSDWEDQGSRERIGSADAHLHVVWQSGQELRRACAYEQGERLADSRPYRLREVAEEYASVILVHRVLTGAERSLSVGDVRFLRVGPETVRCVLPNAGTFRHYMGPNRFYESLHKPGLERWQREHPLARDCPSEEEAMWRLEDVVEELHDARLRWKARYDGLAALDQLFIAV